MAKSVELARSLVNSRELFHNGKMESGFVKPMKYEEWSKSIELDQTVTPNFAAT